MYFTNCGYDETDDDSYHDDNEIFIQRIGPKNYEDIRISKELAAVIVTICDNESYDKIFRQVEQIAPNPDKEYVSVFQINSAAISPLINYIKNDDEINEDLMELMNEIDSLSGECVVFNWECCGGCSDEGFAIEARVVCEFVKLLLDRKISCMFSDFSLKALICHWYERFLGPNPFLIVGDFDKSFELAFSPQELMECPSVQLQKVGELCANGKATVGALGGTIRYTLVSDFMTIEEFKISVLTVVTRSERKNHSKSRSPLCRIGDKVILFLFIKLFFNDVNFGNIKGWIRWACNFNLS